MWGEGFEPSEKVGSMVDGPMLLVHKGLDITMEGIVRGDMREKLFFVHNLNEFV